MDLPVNYEKCSRNMRRKVREEYVRLQDGNCYYCSAPLDGMPAPAIAIKKITKSLYPTGFFNHPVHLHHNHDTEMTIGAIHCHCNAVLWEYDNE